MEDSYVIERTRNVVLALSGNFYLFYTSIFPQNSFLCMSQAGAGR
jgi:hypothetical protein